MKNNELNLMRLNEVTTFISSTVSAGIKCTHKIWRSCCHGRILSNKQEDRKEKRTSVCVLHKCAVDHLWPVCPQRARKKKTIVLMEKLTEAQQPSSCITYSQTSFQRKFWKMKVKRERLHQKKAL